ncbi:MAG: hypothetical protein WDM96_11455 [Lacunisphaera sp.]
MICDQLANAGRYAALGGNFARALAWLRAFDGARPTAGAISPGKTFTRT